MSLECTGLGSDLVTSNDPGSPQLHLEKRERKNPDCKIRLAQFWPTQSTNIQTFIVNKIQFSIIPRCSHGHDRTHALTFTTMHKVRV